MRVLVIIVTCRRPDWLIRCVQSVVQASAHTIPGSRPDLEIAIKVGINGEDPKTLSTLTSLTPTLPAGIPFQYAQLPNGLTPGDARNRLLENETSDWIYFIDDDAFVDEGIFTRFYQVMLQNPTAGVIGGPNLTPDGSLPFQRNLGAALSSRFATFKTVDRYMAYGISRDCGEEALILCNLFVRHPVLPPHPFPTDFICGEENHLLRALLRQGVQLVHSPELAVSHERRGSLKKLMVQVTHYGMSRGQSLIHDPDSRHWAYILPSVCVITGLYLMLKWILGFGLSPALVILTSFYILLSFASAIRVRSSGTSVPMIAYLFFWIHLSYGTGVLFGLVREMTRGSARHRQ
jgi:hypothetical protein